MFSKALILNLNNNAIITVINTFVFVSCWTLLSLSDVVNELLNKLRAKLCLVSVFPHIVKDCPKMRNLPKIFLRGFKNVGSGSQFISK